MANILQVSSPSVNTDNKTLSNPDVGTLTGGRQIRPPADPLRLNRPDGREEGQTGEETYSVIDYESNFGAFVQRLDEGMELPRLMEQLLFKDAAGFLFPDQEAAGGLVGQLLSSIQVESREELIRLFVSRQNGQAKFSGPFFDGLRRILSHHASDGLTGAVMEFLKDYNDYSSGRHLLQQMRSLTDDIGRLMLKYYEPDFKQLTEMINWEAGNGDTAANTGVLNGRLIPFLSNYISRTHDYGAIRDAVMLFILHAVKYENGDGEKLRQQFDRINGSREFRQLFKGDAGDGFESALGELGGRGPDDGFADLFSALLLKGANGGAGLDNIRHFHDIMNGMLINESVYMPLLHVLLPFSYQGKDVMSEMWVDPDSDGGAKEKGRKIKMFLRFDIRNLGTFELLLALQNRQVDMQLYVPPVLVKQAQAVQDHVAVILKNNSLELNRLLVKEKNGDFRLDEIFPEIRERERTINVRI